MPTRESTLPAVNLDFTDDDMARLLAERDPRDLSMVSGSSRRQVARIPGRDDILLRWTTDMGAYFPPGVSQADLANHLHTYNSLLGNLATHAALYIPTNDSFPFAHCQRQNKAVIYTVVEHIDTTPLTGGMDEDFDLIAATGYALAEEASKSGPYIWDHARIEQFGKTKDGRAALLDLDKYITHDERAAFTDLLPWGALVAHHDNGKLLETVQAGRRDAEVRYARRFGWAVAEDGRYIQAASTI